MKLVEDIKKINNISIETVCKNCNNTFIYFGSSNKGRRKEHCPECEGKKNKLATDTLEFLAERCLKEVGWGNLISELQYVFGKQNNHNIIHGKFGTHLGGLKNCTMKTKTKEHINASTQVAIEFCIRYLQNKFNSFEEKVEFLNRYMCTVETSVEMNGKLRSIQTYEFDLTAEKYLNKLKDDKERLYLNGREINADILSPFVLEKTRI